MYHLIAENESGESLELTFNRAYSVLGMDGANPPKASISTAAVSGIDGDVFIGSRVEARNIVLTLAVHHPVEANRIALYSIFRVKRWIKLSYQNSSRKVYITGYVESVELSPWSQSVQPVISIICPQPFWLSDRDISVRFSSSLALFEFPFSIPAEGIEFSQVLQTTTATVDVGEIETGGIITFRARDAVKNPCFYNRTTQKYFGVDIEMEADDIITICTERGSKSVTLRRSGAVSNLLGSRKDGSTWLTFLPGINSVDYDAYSGADDLDVSLTVRPKYEGV